jgi:hypothetical protein
LLTFRLLINSRSLKSILGVTAGIALLYLFLHIDNWVRFEDLALGKESTPIYTSVDNRRIHCNDIDNSQECVDSYHELDREQSVILWLGNSQLDAVNQPTPNAETAATKLHRKFQMEGKYFLTYSQPNANLQEHYILFSHLLTELPITTLVLPVVFDDMREDGIRTSLLSVFEGSAAVQSIKQSDLGLKLYQVYFSKNSPTTDLAGLDDTVQEKVEFALNEKLNEFWTIWHRRPALRGQFLSFLYRSRNWLFGINPSTTRKMIPGRYALNLTAFKEILELAKKNGINVLVYVVPLRSDVKIPYEPQSYSKFKLEMENETIQKGFDFSNFEDVVPAGYWGVKRSTSLGGDSELDFMHFQEEGHHLLAGAIFKKLLGLGAQ